VLVLECVQVGAVKLGRCSSCVSKSGKSRYGDQVREFKSRCRSGCCGFLGFHSLMEQVNPLGEV
jgi:hypothetical protein